MHFGRDAVPQLDKRKTLRGIAEHFSLHHVAVARALAAVTPDRRGRFGARIGTDRVGQPMKVGSASAAAEGANS